MKKREAHSALNEQQVLAFMRKKGQPLSLNDFNQYFSVDRNQRKELKNILKMLMKKGSLFKRKDHLFDIAREPAPITGTLWYTKNGNGFVVPDQENMEDVFVPARFMKNAFHGDSVTVLPGHSFRRKREGKIVDIIKRNINNITGYIDIIDNVYYVIPETNKYNYYFTMKSNPLKQTTVKGDFVAARIIKYPGPGTNPECELTKIFKNGLADINTVTDFIEHKYDLPGKFKKTIESEASGLSVNITNGGNHVDLRSLRHVTIDGDLAKDFDDAVCVRKMYNGFVLFVSIADVSSFVVQHSLLDREAYRRGTSVYFPRKVLPMLPKRLSNDLCSLNPGEEKLTLTVEISYDKDGNPTKSAFYPSVIRSTKRLTYQQVENALIRQDKEARGGMEDHLDDLEQMAELALLIKKKREERGSLDFDLPEPEVILDIEGGVQNIIRSERLFSHQIIEEFMISANEAVARFLERNKTPALYRIHERPDKDKLKEIEKLLHALPGKHKNAPGGSLLQSTLKAARGTNYEFFINRVLLRSMKQARYSASNKGHFGLASNCYLHFTSPIRRYPDLICHRSLKNVLRNTLCPEEDYEKMAIFLSERERTAMEAEREFEDRVRILFMKDKLGNTYRGIISHVTSYGFYVELNDIFVEGLVLLTDLSDDYYHFEEDKFRLIGKRTRKIYRIGDHIPVKVVLADVETKRLLFTPL